MTRTRTTAALLAALTATAGSARADFLTTFDRGQYRSDGFHNPANANYVAGLISTVEFRNFFVFDLSGVGGPVTAARLRLFNPVGGYFSPDPAETYAVFDVSTPVAALVAGAGGPAAFADLGSGTAYGAVTVGPADNGRVVVVDLNAAGVAALNANLGGAFAVGGAVTTFGGLGAENELVFGLTNPPQFPSPADGNTVLELTAGTPPAAVPEAGGGALLAAGAVGLLGRRLVRRRAG